MHDNLSTRQGAHGAGGGRTLRFPYQHDDDLITPTALDSAVVCDLIEVRAATELNKNENCIKRA